MTAPSLNDRSCPRPARPLALALVGALAGLLAAPRGARAQDAGVVAPADAGVPGTEAAPPAEGTVEAEPDAGGGEGLGDIFDDGRSLLGGGASPAGGAAGEDAATTPPAPGDASLADDDLALRGLRIEYDDEDRFRTSGAVTRLDERQLRRFGYDDPTTVVTQAPGVYVRTEDGFGLRPNIGIRGGSAERSKKITLMEDGVLFGPAPYSAPAAYYFPLMMRMTGVEVFKGPAAVLYGPNTVGGALDLTSRDIPDAPAGALELTGGTFGYGRAHLHYGASNAWGGFLAELAHVQSEGFKRIDGSDDPTGFSRTEFVLRGRVQTDQDARVAQRLDVRFGYGREISSETYLGLSDADFRADSWRRYAATQLDRMAWNRTQVQLVHRLLVGDRFELTTTGYRHGMSRTWQRFDRIGNDIDTLGVLRSPVGARRISFDVLTGASDSDRTDPQQAIYLANNARDFVSQGVQSLGRVRARTGSVSHDVRFGARLHYDEADYDQTVTPYWMEARRLVPTGDAAERYSLVRRFALALAVHAGWALEWKGLRVTPGARLEVIDGAERERLAGTFTRSTQVAVLPGLGLSYALGADVSILAGVNRGFSPVAPGQPAASPARVQRQLRGRRPLAGRGARLVARGDRLLQRLLEPHGRVLLRRGLHGRRSAVQRRARPRVGRGGRGLAHAARRGARRGAAACGVHVHGLVVPHRLREREPAVRRGRARGCAAVRPRAPAQRAGGRRAAGRVAGRGIAERRVGDARGGGAGRRGSAHRRAVPARPHGARARVPARGSHAAVRERAAPGVRRFAAPVRRASRAAVPGADRLRVHALSPGRAC